MKIHLVSDGPNMGFRAEPEGADGVPPVSELHLPLLPQSVRPNLLGGAASLAFLPWIAEHLTVPGVVGPELARALREFSPGLEFGSYSSTFWDPPAGPGQVTVSLGSVSLGAGHPADTRIHLVPSWRYRGWLASPRERVFASNAEMFGALAGPFALSCAVLSTALMFVDELDVSEIRVANPGISDAEERLLRSLLEACALKLFFVDGDDD